MFLAAVFGCALFSIPIGTRGADHLDAPGVKTDGRLDINDVYAFQSFDNPDNTVLIMTVNPLAGVLSPTVFSPKGTYDFNIDNDGDAKPDGVLRVSFGAVDKNGRQSIHLKGSGIFGWLNGDDDDRNEHRERREHVRDGKTGQITNLPDGGLLTAGLFDDPFFFDLDGFKHGLQFTGTNFFAGFNVTAIVLEVPSSWFGSDHIGVWATTQTAGGRFDRMGRPAINTVLIPPALKDAFNNNDPKMDQKRFRETVLNSLMALGNDEQRANALADFLLPDILTFDVTSTDGFPNGRWLENDVIDIELNLLTNGAVTGDGVDANDHPFSTSFPYLAPAN
jgi:hypothetical protein